MKIKLLILILTFIQSFSYSQDITSAGKEFYFAFPPNFHQNLYSNYNSLRLGDSLHIFITSDKITKGYIEANDIFGASRTFNFEIRDPNQLTKISVAFWDFEMMSFDFNGNLDRFNNQWGNPLRGQNNNEKVSNLSWHLVSEDDVSVSILNQAKYSSDGTLVFPLNSLGKEYIVAAYYAHNQINTQPTPSQFVIIATEDNTAITITPNCPTQFFKNSIQTIILNKGETYLVQSEVSDNYDLTGTYIKSDKNIAVIGSQLRAKVPINGIGISRDHLISQNLPVDKWGKTAISIPFKTAFQNTSTGLDITRIISSSNNSEIYINKNLYTTLNSSEFIDIPSEEPLYIESNNPICVIQYKKSQSVNNNDFGQSDPLMLILPPVIQFNDSYKLINPNIQEVIINNFGVPTQRRNNVYNSHYINVVIENNAFGSLRLNGNIVIADWYEVPNTKYLYAQIEVQSGTNEVTADAPFGVFCYGYGTVDSYGFIGGLKLNIIDLNPPIISAIEDCFKVNGFISDTLIGDMGIQSVIFSDDDNVELSYFLNDSEVIGEFEARLIDKYQDGRFTIKVIDKNGFETEERYEIKGFTLEVNQANDIIEENLKLNNQSTYCFNYTLNNYGDFTQIIEDIEMSGTIDNFSINLTFPIELNAGSEINFEVCFDSEYQSGNYDLTLTLLTDCDKEDIIYLNIETAADSYPPQILADYNNCDRDIILEIYENNDFDSGVKEFNVIDSLNITLNRILEDNILNLLKYEIKVIDPYQDAYILIQVEDSSGLISYFERTIPGHTLVFGENQERTTEVKFGNAIKGKNNCILLPIYNYGNFPITYHNYDLNNNNQFSIPTSQFPLTILPQNSINLEVCLLSDNIGFIENDIITLNTLCINTDIPLEAFIVREINQANSKCDLQLIIKEDIDFDGFGEVFPNPVSNLLNIELASLYDGNLKYYILDISGNILIQNTINVEQGLYILTIDVSTLNNGSYNIIFEFGNNRNSRKFVIQK
jgi:hypothetical protein